MDGLSIPVFMQNQKNGKLAVPLYFDGNRFIPVGLFSADSVFMKEN